MLYKSLDRTTQHILGIQSFCMLMGSSTHIMWAIEHGLLSKNYHANFFSMVFWDSLTFLDPLAAILLFVKPKAGVYLTLFIITADIIHNNVFYLDELYVNAPPLEEWLVKYWMILGQILFGLFVWVTFNRNISAIRKATLME